MSPQPHPDRALPADPTTRALAREIFSHTERLPIVSMHGHIEASLLVRDEPFPDPTSLLITPDHYLVRMLLSQGVDLEEVRPATSEADARRIWRLFCRHWPAFRGTATRYWLEHVLGEVMRWDGPLEEASAEASYDHVAERLAEPRMRPRALFEAFGIEVLATTDAPEADLADHAALAASGLRGQVVPTFRPDVLLEPLSADWAPALQRLAASADQETDSYEGYVEAIAARRRAFVAAGARATDHSHASADTTPLPQAEARRLFQQARAGELTAAGAAAFTAHMLFTMAELSAQDGLVMQLHHGVLRNHDRGAGLRYGPNLGLDIPTPVEFTRALRPLLESFGRDPRFRAVVFTIDETTYSRELAPLAGVYSSLRLGAPWWFLDAPEAMRRFRAATVETAGFRNTSGFVDDTRAFCSIPARHDLARRIDAGCLASLVAEHRLDLAEAVETAVELAHTLPHQSYPPLLSSPRLVPTGGAS